MNTFIIFLFLLLLIFAIYILSLYNKPQIVLEGRRLPPEECEPNQNQNLCCTLFNYDPDNQQNIVTQQAVYCPARNGIVLTNQSGCFDQNPLCPSIDLDNATTCPLFVPTTNNQVYIYILIIDNTNNVRKFYLTYDENSNSIFMSPSRSTPITFNGSILFQDSKGERVGIVIDSNNKLIPAKNQIGYEGFTYNCGVFVSLSNKMISISNQLSNDNKINLIVNNYDPNTLISNNQIMFYFEQA
jgi:hypothetical protein